MKKRYESIESHVIGCDTELCGNSEEVSCSLMEFLRLNKVLRRASPSDA